MKKQKTLAERFMSLLDHADAFSVREYFVSLGTPANGADYIISFKDESQLSLTWVRIGDEIDDILRFRTPDSLWRSIT
jgi:hypothetical protein